MIRIFAVAATLVAYFGLSATASAEPTEQDGTAYAIGKCYSPGRPPVQRPASFAYNCDNTGVMQDMTWSAWGSDGAHGTGTDSSVDASPTVRRAPRWSIPSSCTRGTR